MKNIKDILLQDCNTVEDYAIRREFYGFLNSYDVEEDTLRANPKDYYCSYSSTRYPHGSNEPVTIEYSGYDEGLIRYLEENLEYFDIYDD